MTHAPKPILKLRVVMIGLLVVVFVLSVVGVVIWLNGGGGMKKKIICYCGSLRVALGAFKKAEYESVLNGDIALLPCCMFVDIQREYGAESDYKIKADELHKRKIDICDYVMVLNVGGYIGESTRSEIKYAYSIGKPVHYLEPVSPTTEVLER